jgi:hypothetical protein
LFYRACFTLNSSRRNADLRGQQPVARDVGVGAAMAREEIRIDPPLHADRSPTVNTCPA